MRAVNKQDTTQKRLMPASPAVPDLSPPWFKVGWVSLLVFCLALRFWGLGRFNTLVFDEVYYAKFAYNYLSHTPFFDGHPPLSKYIIAVGMWLGSHVPVGQGDVNAMVGAPFAPWTYRWINALLGSLIPLVIVGLAFQLTHRRSYALLAGVFAALDGMLLVESRYALNNIHLLILGLLGQWFLLLAVQRSGQQRWARLVLSGVCFGLSASIKWNGLWFLFGTYGAWITVQLCQALMPNLLQGAIAGQEDSPEKLAQADRGQGHGQSAIAKLGRMSPWELAGFLGIVPIVTYILIWIPHLQLNAKTGFWTDFWNLQTEILSYHERVGSGPKVHPYCSTWYSWLVMWRPVAYFYKVTDKGAPLPGSFSAPPTTAEQVIYDVHSMGNPFLWWFSTLAMFMAIALLIWVVDQSVTRWLSNRRHPIQPVSSLPPHPGHSPGANSVPSLLPLNPSDRGLLLFLVVNYCANLLPWARVTRCIFLYHYLGASVYALLALTWLVDRWLRSRQPYLRRMGIATLLIVGLAFLFWLPLYLGLPLSQPGFNSRMWLPSWI